MLHQLVSLTEEAIVSDAENWWQEKSQKASGIASDILVLARRARGAGLDVVALMLELASKEALKDAEDWTKRG